MTELKFSVVDAAAAPSTATPQIALRVLVEAADAAVRVQSILLRVQVRIEAGARDHSAAERDRLKDVFGSSAAVFERAPKSLLWERCTHAVTAFSGKTTVELLLPCGFDLVNAATTYLRGVEHGVVPVLAQFSGTVFVEAAGRLSVSQIPWDREARGAVPVDAITAALDAHYPGVAPVLLARDTRDALHAYRRDRGLASAEAAVAELLLRASRKGDAA